MAPLIFGRARSSGRLTALDEAGASFRPRFALTRASLLVVVAVVLGTLTATPARAVIDVGVAYTQGDWYDGDGYYHVIDAWMNIDRTNHVIRSYGTDDVRHCCTSNYHWLESALMKEGIRQTSTVGYAQGFANELQAYSNPTTPCGGGYGFRAQSWAYHYASGGYYYEKLHYSGLVRTACT